MNKSISGRRPRSQSGTQRFSASYDRRKPWLINLKHDGLTVALPALGGVHTAERWDGLSQPRLLSVENTPQGEEWTFAARSTHWKRFRTVWRLHGGTCRVRHEIVGKGAVDRVSFFETVPADRLPDSASTLPLVRRVRPPQRGYSQPASYFHQQVYCPQPHAGPSPHRPIDQVALTTVAGTFGPVDFNTWFSPGLFCFGLLDSAGAGFFFGLNTEPGGHLYHSFIYQGGGGGWGLSAEFDGHMKVDGKWVSPEVEIAWAPDVETGLRAHVASGRTRGWFPSPAPALPPEWRRPIFCGWGQQCVWSSRDRPGAKPACIDQLIMPSALSLASEKPYREMMRLLDQSELPVGTVTVDMGWSLTQAIPTVDPAKWDNLKGFIAEQHARGRKVLLWLGCWNPQGLPDTMKMKSAPGLRLALDPTLPLFREALRTAIHEALSPHGLNADGFKLDFSGDVPRGPGYEPHSPLWGVELLLDYVGLIYTTMKEADPAAVLETHCANPLFADRTDILRLNDIFDERTDVRPMMSHRAQMARIANDQWVIDTDGDPFISAKAWWDYMRHQPKIGVPSLMSLTGMCRSHENVSLTRRKALGKIWRTYYKKSGIQLPSK